MPSRTVSPTAWRSSGLDGLTPIISSKGTVMKEITADSIQPIDSLLIHGTYGVGKSHLLGSFLAHEKQYGPCVYFHIEGEPSLTGLGVFDLEGVRVVTMESIEDFTKFLKTEGPFHAIALDSLAALNDLADTKETQGLRAPGGGASGQSTGGMAEWGRIKFHILSVLESIKRQSTIMMAVCPSERGENDVTQQKYIVPDLVGKLATRIAHRFSFVGYLEAVTVNPTTVKRQVSFHLRTDALTRANVRKPFTGPIALTTGLDGWVTVRSAIEKAILAA